MKNIILSIVMLMVVISTANAAIKTGFWFKGNTLYWATEGKDSSNNFLLFSMNKCPLIGKCYLDINKENIENVVVTDKKVIVKTKRFKWEVRNINKPTDKWVVMRIK